MPSAAVDEAVQTAGAVIGTVALTAAVFVGVSFFELKKKVDGQLERGEDPYKFQVDRPEEDIAKPVRSAKAAKTAQSSANMPGFRANSSSGGSKKKRPKKSKK
eukprot:jgi/Ulvmu1/8782/UM048_0037.1